MAERSHRVVFELSSGEAQAWSAVLNNVENVRKALGPAETSVAVIAHGAGIAIYQSADAEVARRMSALVADGVEFDACANTLASRGIPRGSLPPGVHVVDSGVAEMVRRQEGGWSYVKSG